jgi:hypothetical protein
VCSVLVSREWVVVRVEICARRLLMVVLWVVSEKASEEVRAMFFSVSKVLVDVRDFTCSVSACVSGVGEVHSHLGTSTGTWENFYTSLMLALLRSSRGPPTN